MSSPSFPAASSASAPPSLSSALSADGAVAASVGPRNFPLILTRAEGAAIESLEGWVAAHQPELESLLARFGAILFRRFVRAPPPPSAGAPRPSPSPSAQLFSSFVSGFRGRQWTDLPYEHSLSYAVRAPVCARVCTTNEGRAGGLVWHHEQAQAPKHPRVVFFFAEEPAAAGCGGATGVTPSTAVVDALAAAHPAFLADCEAKGLVYRATLPPHDGASSGVGRSWRSFWRCDTQAQAEARMAALGYACKWEGDVLHMTTPALPAVVVASGRRTFFNQAIAQALGNAQSFAAVGGGGAPPALSDFLTLGDGAPVDVAALRFAAQVCDAHAYDIEWQRSDVAMIDNYLVMHARRPWSGDGPRVVLASLVDEPSAPLPVVGAVVNAPCASVTA